MKSGSEKAELMEVNEHFERLSLTYPYLGLGVQDDFCIQLDSLLARLRLTVSRLESSTAVSSRPQPPGNPFPG
uniref:Uncharacterized protein n=1 Tax=Candidatus Kentrum sp. FM TaxID=2126340 RepID=A0A450U3P4_9GAMM|nr:MAG: hypothetical protein BECKFM1743A_GA0114220_110292 [Candidatus Kentron sp. FM]